MLKSTTAARLFNCCCNSHSIYRPVVFPLVTFLLLIWLNLFLLASSTQEFTSTKLQSEPRSLNNEQCQTNIPGDCNPHSCQGNCEGRYVRFWDNKLKVDRTVKSCQCVQESVCSLIGMNAYTGCQTYTTLSTTAQRFIRLWTISDAEKLYKRSSIFTSRSDRFWDRLRHNQLLHANSRFCCHTTTLSNSITLRYTLLSILLPVLFVIFW